jgi:putative ABC transport system ATP-binding protein
MVAGAELARRSPVPVVVTTALTRTYGTGEAAVHALRGIDLRVERGEFVALMGPSGCGKSTLLHLLGGLDRATSGTVEVDGHALQDLGESARAILRRATIGIVFQAYNLVPNLCLADNVELPGRLAGLDRGELDRRRDHLLGVLGLRGRERALPSELSGGQQQRGAIARALVNHPAVLLADEPTGNLDSHAGAEVLALLGRVHATGQTLVVVTHDPLVAAHAERVVYLRDGRLVDELRPAGPADTERVLERLAALQVVTDPVRS